MSADCLRVSKLVTLGYARQAAGILVKLKIKKGGGVTNIQRLRIK